MSAANHKTSIALYSVIVGVVLTSMKAAVGLLTGSLGIISEALHSLLDLGAAIITYFSVRISGKPPDKGHQYGHGKIENISALAEAFLLLATCIWVVAEAIDRLFGKAHHVEATFWSFFVMGVSLALDIFISRLLYHGAKKYSSQALKADALHYSSDIFSSVVVIVGLAGVKLGVPALDPIAALGVAIFVIVASIRLCVEAVSELLDRAPAGMADAIRKLVNSIPGIENVENVRVRRSGPSTFIDMVVCAGRILSLTEGHRLADKVEAEVRGMVPGSDVVVHLEPTKHGGRIEDTVRATVALFPQIQDVHNVEWYRDETDGACFVSFHLRLASGLSLEDAHGQTDAFEAEIKKEIPAIKEAAIHIETQQADPCRRRAVLSSDDLHKLYHGIMEDRRLKGIHDILLHEGPNKTMLSCHILSEKDITIEDAHQMATGVENKIRKLFPFIDEVIVHTEPS